MNDELTLAHRRQLEKLALLESRGETVGGWKLGQTSGESRDAFGPGIRAFAWLRRSRMFPSGTRLDWSAVGNGGIENEVCFVLGEDITEPVSAGTVRDALAGFAPAFQINQRRISKDAPVSERIADGLANFGIVVSELRPGPCHRGTRDTRRIQVRVPSRNRRSLHAIISGSRIIRSAAVRLPPAGKRNQPVEESP